MPAGVVIAGAGQAGFQAAASLRSEGYEGAITLIGEEPGLPYQRPPLSKTFMSGKQDIDAVTLRPESYYHDHRIELLMGERIAAIDPSRNSVRLARGSDISYGSLVLATGARNRRLPASGADLDGVCYLRTRAEALDIFERLQEAREIVVIGGGFIGLELAATATQLGKQVAVIEARTRLMWRSVPMVMSDFFRELHAKHGVKLALGAAVREIVARQKRASEVVLADGTIYPADLVLVGVGIVPNTELAESAGLPVSDGIAVDEQLRTGAANIYAIGDCVRYPSRFAGGDVRLESVQNAVDQARCVAAAITGHPRSYEAVPWFWTDQFDAKLQMAGLSHGHDTVITRGAPESSKFSVYYFKENRLLAVDSVNRPADHMAGRKMLAAGTPVTPEQIA